MDTAKFMNLEEFINLNAYIRKEYKLKTSVLNLLLKNSVKEHKSARKSERSIKDKKKIFIENQQTIEKYQQSQKLFLWKD